MQTWVMSRCTSMSLPLPEELLTDAVPRAAHRTGGRGRSFSSVERALLLREVHLFRFVDTEFLRMEEWVPPPS